jgi:hypothetical protein
VDVSEGAIDRATVMAHEYGHLVGWLNPDPEKFSGHLMAGELVAGERRGVEAGMLLVAGNDLAEVAVSDCG